MNSTLTQITGVRRLDRRAGRFLPRPLPGDRSRPAETSLETGLPVYNVTRGARPARARAGTMLNNLVALGVGRIVPLGFAGDDGEGFELLRALRAMPGVSMDALRANAAAAHLHLLQAAGARAGQAAARAQPPGQQELDAHAGRGRRPAHRRAGASTPRGSTP